MINNLDQRKEIVQDVIDRLLYLDEAERIAFTNALHSLCNIHQTKVINVNGLRIVPSNC